MPFKEQNRRDSWPPTIVRLRNNDSTPIDDIDENPFAYFLTSTSPRGSETECDYFEDLTAGIESDDEVRTPIREVSPSAIQRIPFETKDDSRSSTKDIESFPVPLTLRDFTLSHESKKHDKTLQKQQMGNLDYPTPSLRGRHTIRLTSSRLGRGRGMVRSLSATRAHSWREPSPEVYPIPEEREEAEQDLSPQLYSDVHGHKRDSAVRGEAVVANATKVKKRVRWALP
jgi:hypothetical protein